MKNNKNRVWLIDQEKTNEISAAPKHIRMRISLSLTTTN